MISKKLTTMSLFYFNFLHHVGQPFMAKGQDRTKTNTWRNEINEKMPHCHSSLYFHMGKQQINKKQINEGKTQGNHADDLFNNAFIFHCAGEEKKKEKAVQSKWQHLSTSHLNRWHLAKPIAAKINLSIKARETSTCPTSQPNTHTALLTLLLHFNTHTYSPPSNVYHRVRAWK